MNLHVFCTHISIMLLLQYALSKTLPDANELDREPDGIDSSDDTESLHETNHNSLKHSKSEKLKGHNRWKKADDEQSDRNRQCAVMYKNDEPVGILKPYKDSYQFLPIHKDELISVEISPYADSLNSVKRDTSSNKDSHDETHQKEETPQKEEDLTQFSDERYPYIFAKFKIDSRVEKQDGIGNAKQRSLHKRESAGQSLLSERHADSLKSTLTKIQTNDEGAEIELRSILSDMGLIDDETHMDKREAELNEEDEDMEHGTNKMNLIKLDSTDERPKRGDSSQQTVTSKQPETATKTYGMIEIPEPKSINEEQYIDEYLNKDHDHSAEKKQNDREKRSDIKSKKMSDALEHEIQAKLRKIKEEVRQEIEKVKNNNNEDFEEDNEDNVDQAKEKSQRRKRNVIISLMDEETSDINPVISGENNLVPHIRRRRSISEDYLFTDKIENPTEKAGSGNDDQSLDLNPNNAAISVIEKSDSDLIIDLDPETDSEGSENKKENMSRRSNENKSRAKVKSRKDDYNNNKATFNEKELNNTKKLLTTYKRILDTISELESLRYGQNVEQIPDLNITKKEYPFYESTTSTNQYLLTTDQHFLMRKLKEYEEESNTENNKNENLEENLNKDDEMDLDEDINSGREKKSCKCTNGDKECKCEKHQRNLVQTDDETHFLNVDGVPGPLSRPIRGPIVKDSTVKLKCQPADKKKSPSEAIRLMKNKAELDKPLINGGYTLDLYPDVYKIIEEKPTVLDTRKKRNSFSDLVAIHGGSPIIDHLVAIRERSMLPRVRVKRKTQTKGQTEQQLTLTDMSEEDLFGALPQSFEGELARYKRVKRSN